jgi:hypothetical protein
MSDESVPLSYALVVRLRMDLKDLLARLREELEGKTAKSPEAWRLLRDASVIVGHSQAALRLATVEIERLQGELARRKPPDDDGLAETVPVEPPNRPRGGPAAFASKLEGGNESVRGVEESLAIMVEVDKTTSDWSRSTTTNQLMR